MASIACGGFYGYETGNSTYGFYHVYLYYDALTRNGTTITLDNAYVQMKNPNSGYTTNTVYVDDVVINGKSTGISGSAYGGYSYHTWSTGIYDVNFTAAATLTSCSVVVKCHRTGQSSGAQSCSGTLSLVEGDYVILYDANGGVGAPADQAKYNGTNITLSSTKPTRFGYTFKGWGTFSSDTSVAYAPGATYSANASIVLYAIWEVIPCVQVKSGSSWVTGTLTYKSGSSYLPVSTIKLKTNGDF